MDTGYAVLNMKTDEDKRREAIRTLIALYKDKVTGKTQWSVKGNLGLAKHLRERGHPVTHNMVNMWIRRGHIPFPYTAELFRDGRTRPSRAGLKPQDVCKHWR